VIHTTLRRGLLLAATGFAFAASGQAFAATASAQLAAAVKAPTTTEIDGRVWTCTADKCEGAGDGSAQSLKRECKRVAAELGALKAYSSENGKVDDAGLVVCNAK
jgi:hypothetical protein